MCTVTIISSDERIRLACNRDELRTRELARPPVIRRFGDHQAIMPIDPLSDGTWVAANDAGVLMALLNVNDGRSTRAHQSRGTIIPKLLRCDSAQETARLAVGIDTESYSPFRLIIADCATTFEVSRASIHQYPIDTPLLFTSSGLGDHLVQAPRRQLFDHWLSDGVITPARQDAFHKHRWPDREHLSIRMSRTDACTVSYTTIELTAHSVVMNYQNSIIAMDLVSMANR